MIGSIGGIVLIVLGAVFLLNNLGIAKLPIRELAAKWWPAILILVGVSLLTRRLKKYGRFARKVRDSFLE